MSSKRSRVHPKYKTKYRVVNWPEYDRSLVQRGDVTRWLSPTAAASWNAKPCGRRGGQAKYSDLAIETAPTLRSSFIFRFDNSRASWARSSRSWASISNHLTTPPCLAADDNSTFRLRRGIKASTAPFRPL